MKTGGVVLTMMPDKWHRGGVFNWWLHWWQRIFLWFRYAHAEWWGKSCLSPAARKVAARISHIHLDVGQSNTGRRKLLSITMPHARFEWWPPERIMTDPALKWGTDPACLDAGVKHIYLMPAFRVNDTMAQALEDCAERFVDEKHRRYYDFVQLFGFVLNLFLWIVRPSKWGKQINKRLNLPGGQEVCSTGAALILRHAEFRSIPSPAATFSDCTMKAVRRGKVQGSVLVTGRLTTQFFPGYDTAMIPPCLSPLSPQWDATAILNVGEGDDGTTGN